MRRESNAFWKFSLALYRADGVADACLTLQERRGADVNLLLYCCWLGQAGRALDRRTLRATMARVSCWQTEVVNPLRQARRALKHPPDGLPAAAVGDLRKRIGTLELDLEYMQQRLLVDAAQALAPTRRTLPRRQAVLASLSRYLALLEVPPGQAAAQLTTLLDACCPAPDRA